MTDFDEAEIRHLFALEQSTQLFEKLVTKCYQGILVPGDTVVDVGAHKGWHTIPMALAVGATGKVHAFDAIPTLVDELRDLIAAKELAQIEIHGKAVSSMPGASTFYWIRNGEGVSGLRERDVRALVSSPDVSVIQVEVTTLDLLPSKALEKWRFCKLDIEGAELDALRGGRNAILQHKPVLVFENGRGDAGAVYGYSRDQYFSFFASLGYIQFDLFGRDFGPDQWALPYIPWNTIAVAAGSADEDFACSKYPDLLHEVRRTCEIQA